jgi:hypothetical protein
MKKFLTFGLYDQCGKSLATIRIEIGNTIYNIYTSIEINLHLSGLVSIIFATQ